MDRHEACRQVARLHIACIDQGFLSQLGEDFLTLMYEAIDASPDAALIVASDGERVVGFVAGAMAMKPVYSRMLRRFPRLVWVLAPSLVRPARIRRILEIRRYGAHPGGDARMPEGELLSIAVDPAFRGKHRADALYRQLGEFFASRGQHAFKIVAGQALESAHRFYQRMGAAVVGEVQVHAGERSLVYVQRLPQLGPDTKDASSRGAQHDETMARQ